jgi:hypothetical protein
MFLMRLPRERLPLQLCKGLDSELSKAKRQLFIKRRKAAFSAVGFAAVVVACKTSHIDIHAVYASTLFGVGSTLLEVLDAQLTRDELEEEVETGKKKKK